MLACASSAQAATSDVLAEAADALRDGYVFPAVGARMATLLDAGAADGTYTALSGTALAERLTSDLRALSHDRHLGVRYAGEAGSTPRKPSPYPAGRPEDAGIPAFERRADGIGYLRIDRFLELGRSQARIDAAMKALGGSRALIVDLRENGGGNGAAVAEVTSWLFDRALHLNDMHWRVDWAGRRDTVDSTHTEPKPGSRLTRVPVYVLISNKTFSAGEEFAYNLRQLGRATLVGEATGGGAHPVRFVALGDDFQLVVPSGRSVNPVSGTNWEGVGVQPHVVVPAGEAEARAVALIDRRSGGLAKAGPTRMFPGLGN